MPGDSRESILARLWAAAPAAVPRPARGTRPGTPARLIDALREALEEAWGELRPIEARSQLDLFGGAPEASPPLDVEAAGVLEELRAFDPERSTPIEALVALQRWVSRLRGEGAE